MGAGGHHHVPRAVRGGAEALILRAAAAELAELEERRKMGKGGREGKGEKRLRGNASFQTLRQQSGQQGKAGGGGKDVWATVLAGAGRWAAIAEGMGDEEEGSGVGASGGGGGETLRKKGAAVNRKKTSVGSRARAPSAARKKRK